MEYHGSRTQPVAFITCKAASHQDSYPTTTSTTHLIPSLKEKSTLYPTPTLHFPSQGHVIQPSSTTSPRVKTAEQTQNGFRHQRHKDHPWQRRVAPSSPRLLAALPALSPLPPDHPSTSKGLIGHVQTHEANILPESHTRRSTKRSKFKSPCADNVICEAGVEDIFNLRATNRRFGHLGDYRSFQLDGVHATEALPDKISQTRVEPGFTYHLLTQNCQWYVIKMVRSLVACGHGTQEAVDFVRRQGLLTIRFKTHVEERRHPLGNQQLDGAHERRPPATLPAATRPASRYSAAAMAAQRAPTQQVRSGSARPQNLGPSLHHREEAEKPITPLVGGGEDEWRRQKQAYSQIPQNKEPYPSGIWGGILRFVGSF
ncbi:hypothetical protein BU23DRAFT_564145 [Bimuria novae-zelandiae CBS 107.79]|uniref:Uncharacterized protein n=1 Tax=Bimuria novae-zelandiae CBS 107.79 TaxID=1447943 RepID=A0A6A5VPU0_9PLEO|nr:hypothetical protein BU23DRAFT_564145 [Bimuria novae-zelandiae CBS 107.79]